MMQSTVNSQLENVKYFPCLCKYMDSAQKYCPNCCTFVWGIRRLGRAGLVTSGPVSQSEESMKPGWPMRGPGCDECDDWGLGDTVTGIINQMSYRDTERQRRQERGDYWDQRGRSIYTITTGPSSSQQPAWTININ